MPTGLGEEIWLMIPCKHCNTPNSLDSTFCKRCGTGLPEDEIATAKLKLEKIVEEGFHALNEGRVEEAMAIAETAVTSDPSMASAHSLKSNAHERRGQIAEALESAEKLVELNPDSELDKIKRNQLRAALGASALNNRAPSKGVAVVAALSAAAIVLCGAIWVTKLLTMKSYDARVAMNTPVKSETTVTAPVSDTAPTNNQEQVQAAPKREAAPQTSPTAPSNVVQPDQGADQSQTDEGNSATDTESRVKVDKSSSLPSPDGTGLEIGPVTPPTPPASSNQGGIVGSSPKQVTNHDADPGPMPDSAPRKAAPPVDKSVIEIKVHDDHPGLRRTGSADTSEMPRETSRIYMKMGNDYYQMGNYSGAAANLQKAVDSGADPVSANYRLAQSYSSLGRSSEAAAAYKRAITAASNSLNSGHGDSAKLKAVRDAAETALHQIQGG